MAKLSKKVAKKTVKKAVSNVPKQKIYTVIFNFNGETITKRNADIKKAILSAKPEILYTEMFITIKHGKGDTGTFIERHLNLVQGKRIFLSEETLDIFMINLLL